MSGARGVSARVTDAGGPAGQYDAARGKLPDAVRGRRVRPDLAIDAVLAHASRDQLRDLAAEIEDQDAVGHSSP